MLPKGYSRPLLPATQLGRLVDVVSNIGLNEERHRQQDLLGRVYENFPGAVRQRRGKEGRRVLHPRSVVRVLEEMRAPYRGRVYDPCCGSGGWQITESKAERFGNLSAHSRRFIAHRPDIDKIKDELRVVAQELILLPGPRSSST